MCALFVCKHTFSGYWTLLGLTSQPSETNSGSRDSFCNNNIYLLMWFYENKMFETKLVLKMESHKKISGDVVWDIQNEMASLVVQGSTNVVLLMFFLGGEGVVSQRDFPPKSQRTWRPQLFMAGRRYLQEKTVFRTVASRLKHNGHFSFS